VGYDDPPVAVCIARSLLRLLHAHVLLRNRKTAMADAELEAGYHELTGLGDRGKYWLSGMLLARGQIKLRQGDVAAARDCYQHALTASREADRPDATAAALVHLAEIQEFSGEMVLAAASIATAIDHYRELGMRPALRRALDVQLRIASWQSSTRGLATRVVRSPERAGYIAAIQLP